MDRVHLRRRGKTWWIDYCLSGKRVRESLGTTDRKEAELRRAEKEVLFRRGDLLFEQPVRIDVFLREYLDYQRARRAKKGFETDRVYLERFLEACPLRRITDLTTLHVTTYLTGRKNRDDLAGKTLNRIREVLHTMGSYAVAHGYLRDNPVSRVKRFREIQEDIVFLTAPQIDEFLHGLQGDLLHDIATTLIFAGLRRAEACWLTWEDVDIERELLHIRPKEADGVGWVPKTGKSRRVPIHRRLLPVLRKKGRHPTWVHPSPKGTRWDGDNLTHRFARTMKGLKLPWRIMDLRHTFGSHLAQKGVSSFKIATVMGNSSQIVEKYYARLVPEEMHAELEF